MGPACMRRYFYRDNRRNGYKETEENSLERLISELYRYRGSHPDIAV